MEAEDVRREKIRNLNDAFRKTGAGGKVFLTQGVHSLPDETRSEILSKVRTLDEFEPENDPYGEHDFGIVFAGSVKAYYKIDYYDADMQDGSEDPSDPAATTRVMTVMLAHEY